jgi:hypothetical protein
MAYVYVTSVGGGGVTGAVYRLDYADVPDLQAMGTTPPNRDTSEYKSLYLTSTGWKSVDVKTMVQKQVDLSGWNKGQKMGFCYADASPAGSTSEAYIEAVENTANNPAYLSVTWSPDDDISPPSLFMPGPSSVFLGQTVRFTVTAYDKSGIGTDNTDIKLEYQFPSGSTVTKYRSDLQTDGNGKWWYDVACGSQTGQGWYRWTVYDNDNDKIGRAHV